MDCKFCGKDRKLVKAHIIPKSFFKAINKTSVPSKLITNNPNIPPKKSPIGIYDPKLVCTNCEDKFKKPDDYAYNFFTKKVICSSNKIFDNNELLGFFVTDINYELLKLFFISLLWRASTTTNKYYGNVKASVFHDDLKYHINSNSPGTRHDFSVIIWKYDSDPELIAMVNPWEERFFGVRCYNFILYGFHCIVKAASHNLPSAVYDQLLSPENDLFIKVENYKKTRLYENSKKLVHLQKYRVY